jgi:dipeptidyl aminopeptidase/acylaminoacyl peptidase
LLLAQEKPKTPERKATASPEKWTIDDVLLAEHAEEWRIAPDSRSAVWVKRAMDKDKGEAVSHLVLTPLAPRSKAEGENIELTRGTESCTHPRWSPDSRRIAFLSSRPSPKSKSSDAAGDDKDDAKTQLWLINPLGGEPWPLTESPRDVRDFHWADADTIVFAAQEKASHRETTLKEKKDTSEVVEDEAHEPPVRLYKIGLKEKKVVRLTNNKDRIQEFALSPDGKWAVTIHERSLRYTFDHKIKPAMFLYDVRTGQGKQIFERGFNIKEIHWTPDSKGFYAVNAFTSHADYLMAYIGEVHHYDLGTQAVSKVDLDWPNGLSDAADPSLAVTPDGFLTLLANGVRPRAARYTRAGMKWTRAWLSGDHAAQLFNLTLAPDGKTLVYMHSTASMPDQWYRAKLEGIKIVEPAVVTELDDDFQKKPRARTEVVRWKGALGEEIEGILYYPHAYDEARQGKYPLVVMIHGGPAGADFDNWEERWAYPANLVCARGAFVFKPNYHGSTNYGLKFVESIANGKYYELPVVDIEKGVDALAVRGLIDPGRVALSGWSNGAILTMALITRNSRYVAASAGAGGSEWVADWGACEFGMSFSNYYLGKSPLEDPQTYFKNAPFYDFPKVRTPTLLFHGTQDRVVPTHHAWMQYRALQQLGKTDVRLVLFPDEKHGLKKYAHQKRKIQEELAWLDKYLFKKNEADDEALKPDSPLALALERNKVKRDGRLYGVVHQSTLIPETVTTDRLAGVQVGRFEVTRAQFARFDKNYLVEPGKENYPANGITLDQARSYCAWLGKLTGQTYRLPTEEESAKLLDDLCDAENTLDTWAGYTVNPEDAARLQAKLRELPGTAPLLKEVGSFKGQGKDPIFDLGGNVAEWVLMREGAGKTKGGSADRPAEERRVQAGAEYVGFRVLRKM